MSRSDFYQPSDVGRRFVVLFHQVPASGSEEFQHRSSHWDLMIESGDALETWALAEELLPGKTVSAQRLPSHRLAYLTYEGAISGDRGSVKRVVAGYVEGSLPTDFSAKCFSIRLRSDQFQEWRNFG